MAISSQTLARLVEPALYALANPSKERVHKVLDSARQLARELRKALREGQQEIDQISFELGAGTAIVELLATTEQRCDLGDAVRSAQAISNGIQTLHIVGFFERSANVATQGELADRLGVDRGNFNRHVKKLEELGLIVAQRQGRTVVYSLSPLGLEVLSQSRPGWRAIHPESEEEIESEAAATKAASEILVSMKKAVEKPPIGARRKFTVDHVSYVMTGYARPASHEPARLPRKGMPVFHGSAQPQDRFKTTQRNAVEQQV